MSKDLIEFLEEEILCLKGIVKEQQRIIKKFNMESWNK